MPNNIYLSGEIDNMLIVQSVQKYEYLGQKQSPKPLFQQWVDKTKDEESPPVMFQFGPKVNVRGKYDSPYFDKNNAIDGNQQECTESEDQSFMNLKSKFVKLVNHVRIVTFLNRQEFNIGPR